MAVERSVAAVLQNMLSGWWGVKSGTTDTAQMGYFTDGAGHVIDKSVSLSPRNMPTVTPVAISGTSAQSGAIAATEVDLCATVAAMCVIGTNPTATLTAGAYLPAGVMVRYSLQSGDKVAVIGTSGTLYITPVGAI
jgi:hypothetical protein